MIQQSDFNFVKLRNILLLVTIFALWFSVFSNEQIEGTIAYVLIFSFGILHGSNDILLIQVASRELFGNHHKIKVLALYIMTILTILLLFSFLPKLALLSFVLISGFHFGEQHWGKNLIGKDHWDKLFFTLYGLFILFMIFYIKSEQASDIINDVSGFSIKKETFLIILSIVGALLAIQWILYVYMKRLKANVFEELFFLVVFFVVFSTATLLWGFSIYFIVWHSVPSLIDQMNFLYGRANQKTFFKYLKSSWWYWLISIISLIGFYFLLRDDNEFFTSILIYFLAAITFPHVIVMSKLESS
ncbi:hypothetical protein HME9304_00763 [Flagellimonas maritima]|uniref:Probable beta-carotene 15,15'-dioxygenase n=1 Tax=Flagellimonas maritima TaxID=1383885 RepID=A0A2Z4LPQ2_9FLAO|nr:hypothetical protein HME9304_00763 [Allomuricauda aurantiaca]